MDPLVGTSPLLPGSTVLSCPDNTRADKLVDLVPDDGVLHVVLECGRICLSLLENRLHHGVVHDLLHRKPVSGTGRNQYGEKDKQQLLDPA